jgi:hypothetical protein
MMRSGAGRAAVVASLALVLGLAACSRGAGTGTPAARALRSSTTTTTSTSTSTTTTSTTTTTTTTTLPPAAALHPLTGPAPLAPFDAVPPPGEGAWTPAGRNVGGVPAVYETDLVPPGGVAAAGIAWMDTKLLSARLYSGSKSPGGGPYLFTAPVLPAQAVSLVAAFNGGFLMKDAGGGYYTEGRTVYPLVAGSASLVIDADGSVSVGAWGSDVTMTPTVAAVRQNLVLLVAGGQPTIAAANPDWRAWGNTCAATTCSGSVPGVENQWRSGVGVTADGALVYVAGPALDPLQLAQLLARAGVVRGMELDINPYWPVFATYAPAPGVAAAPANGSSLHPSSVQGPATFFTASWARDFVTMSARSVPAPIAPG